MPTPNVRQQLVQMLSQGTLSGSDIPELIPDNWHRWIVKKSVKNTISNLGTLIAGVHSGSLQPPATVKTVDADIVKLWLHSPTANLLQLNSLFKVLPREVFKYLVLEHAKFVPDMLDMPASCKLLDRLEFLIDLLKQSGASQSEISDYLFAESCYTCTNSGKLVAINTCMAVIVAKASGNAAVVRLLFDNYCNLSYCTPTGSLEMDVSKPAFRKFIDECVKGDILHSRLFLEESQPGRRLSISHNKKMQELLALLVAVSAVPSVVSLSGSQAKSLCTIFSSKGHKQFRKAKQYWQHALLRQFKILFALALVSPEFYAIISRLISQYHKMLNSNLLNSNLLLTKRSSSIMKQLACPHELRLRFFDQPADSIKHIKTPIRDQKFTPDVLQYIFSYL